MITEGDETELHLDLVGFQRLGKGLQVSRRFHCGSDSLEICDEISGEGRREITTYFHFHPEWEVEERGEAEYRIHREGGSVVLKRIDCGAGFQARLLKGRRKPVAGWYSSRYGQAVPCWTLICKETASLPARNRYRIQ